MRFKKMTSFILITALILSQFCGLSSFTGLAQTGKSQAYMSFNNSVVKAPETLYNFADNSAGLSDMKYIYFYINAGGVSGNLNFTVNETETGGAGTYVLKEGGVFRGVWLNGDSVSWDNNGGLSQCYIPGDKTDFEGYLIFEISSQFTEHPGYTPDKAENGLNPEHIDYINIYGLETGFTVGKFGFARTFSDAQNACSGNLSSDYDEDISIINSYVQVKNTNTDFSVECFKDSTKDISEMQWAGFYLKTDDYMQFNLAFVENNEAWWWLSDSERSYYWLRNDGKLQKVSAEAGQMGHGMNTYYANPSGFEGYVIFNIAESVKDTHPGYTGGGDKSLTLNDLNYLRLFSISMNETTEYTIGNFALSADIDKLVSYYSDKATPESWTLNVISHKGAGSFPSQLTDAVKPASANWFGFHLNTNSVPGDLRLIVHETSEAGGGGYWPAFGRAFLIYEDGETAAVSPEDGFIKEIPADFIGYIIFELSVLSETHPAYPDNKGSFEASDIQSFEVANAQTDWIIQYPSLSESADALLEHLKEEKAETHFENAFLINANSFEKAAEQPGNSVNMEIDNLDYIGRNPVGMNWFGFRLETDNSGEMLTGIAENNGALYWIAAGADYYMISDAGELLRKTARSNGDIYADEAFSGYLIIPFESLVLHPAYTDANGILDPDSIDYIQIWNNFGSSKKFGRFALAKTDIDLIDFLVNANVDTAVIHGDVNSDGTVNILDLINLKKYHAGIGGESEQANLDVNCDGMIDAGDIAALRKLLLNYF